MSYLIISSVLIEISVKINCTFSSQGKLVTPLVGHSRIEVNTRHFAKNEAII